YPNATIVLAEGDRTLAKWTVDLSPAAPLLKEMKLSRTVAETALALRVVDRKGSEIISYRPKPRAKGPVPPPATEPPAPADIPSADELFITGLHLEQYRHATRSPVLYWREALRRDPLDSRCNNAMGLWFLRRGEFTEAESHFRKAIERLTRRNANPYEGEAYYNLGLCLRFQNRDVEAYAAFYKATWNQAWQSAGYHALAELDCRKSDWQSALDHLNRSLRCNADNIRARNLKTMVLRMLHRQDQADSFLSATLALDPLDWWARLLNRQNPDSDLQVRLDIAHDLARAGFRALAISVLKAATAGDGDLPTQSLGAAPLVQYTLGWLCQECGDRRSALMHFRRAAALPPDYCFPSRLEEFAVLEAAIRANPTDARAPYYLGNLLYDRRRHNQAIKLWEQSARLDSRFSVVWRNLGIGYFNIHNNPAKARAAYDQAFKAEPCDARLLFERDQLWKRLGEKPAKRLRELVRHPALLSQRDDLTVELCALLNQTGRHVQSGQLLAGRKFQPWEGGEGGPLAQHVRTQLALGRDALTHHDYPRAADHFENALTAPHNLGEARHLLANQSDAHYWAGVANDLLGQRAKAKRHWLAAANFKGDFQAMSVRAFSEMTYYSALSFRSLGRDTKARQLLRQLLAYARQLHKSPAKIDYFATSLPTMLLFDDDLQLRQRTTALFLQAQAWLGLGHKSRARTLLQNVLQRDPNHALAADLFAECFHRKVKS
ncbi:MAG: tetratricopeptide repeat protein, partial [Tepidisphaeraceae bacterium]